MKLYCTFLLILVLLFIFSYRMVNSTPSPRTDISVQVMDTLFNNHFAFPELLNESDRKIIERYNFIDYYVEVDETTKRLKLDSIVIEKVRAFGFLDEVYEAKKQSVEWRNVNVLDCINQVVNHTKESYLNKYRQYRQYNVHHKREEDIDK